MQNAVPQGLSSSIFTTNLKAAEAFLAASGSDCGIANVNIGTSRCGDRRRVRRREGNRRRPRVRLRCMEGLHAPPDQHHQLLRCAAVGAGHQVRSVTPRRRQRRGIQCRSDDGTGLPQTTAPWELIDRCTDSPALSCSPRCRARARARAGVAGGGLPQRAQSAAGAPAPSRCRQGVRPDVPESGRPGRRPGQERRAHRCAAGAGLRLRRGRHGHAAAAAGQSEAAHVPPAGARAVINRLGFNNDGVDALVRNVERAQRKRRPARHQHRQEQGHAERIGGGRLPVLPGARVSAGRLHHRQHLLAQHRRPARTAGRTGAAPPGRHAARGAGAARRAARQARADAGEDRAGPVATTTSMPPRACSATSASTASSPPTPRSSRIAVQDAPPRRRSRRPVRRAADGQVHRGPAHAAHAPAGSDPADRRRRHPQRRRRGREDGRRRDRWCSATPA